MAVVGWITLVAFATAAAAVTRGAVLVVLWGWFMEPLGLPHLDLIHAIGVSLVVGFLVFHDSGPSEEPPKEAFLRLSLVSLTLSAISLGLGWAYHLFL